MSIRAGDVVLLVIVGVVLNTGAGAGQPASVNAGLPAQGPSPTTAGPISSESAEHIRALSDPDWRSRQTAAQRLADQRGPQVVQALIAALSDRDHRVRKAAVESLGRIGDPQAAGPLLKVLNDPGAGREAADALGALGSPVRDQLIAALHDKGTFAPGYAARALGRLGDKAAVETLIATLQTIGSSAAYALGEIGDPRAVEPLLSTLGHKDPYARSAAIVALTQFRDERAIGPMARALDDPSPIVAAMAARSLAAWGHADGIAALDASLTNTPVRLAALAGAYDYFLRKDGPTACRERCDVERPLVSALLAHGQQAMARDFYHCRNSTLRVGARIWAFKRGETSSSWPKPECGADSVGLQERAASAPPTQTATVHVIHTGGGPIDVDAGDSYRTVLTKSRYTRALVAAGTVTLQARWVAGYAQQLQYRVWLGSANDKAPIFTHAGVLEEFYEPAPQSKSDSFGLELRDATIFPYVSRQTMERPDPAANTSIDITVEPGKTYYYSVRENDKRVHVVPVSPDEAGALIQKARPTSQRFLATVDLAGTEHFLPVGEMTTVGVVPVCARIESDGFFTTCLSWRLLKDKEKPLKTFPE